MREAAGRANGRLVGGAVGAEAGVLSDRAGGDNGGDVARLNFGVVLGSVEAGGVGGVAAGDGVAMRADGRGPPRPRLPLPQLPPRPPPLLRSIRGCAVLKAAARALTFTSSLTMMYISK